MTEEPDNPWRADNVPAVRPEDVPPPGWGQTQPGGYPQGSWQGWNEPPPPPHGRFRGPGSVAGLSTLSACCAWVALLCLSLGVKLSDAVSAESGLSGFGLGIAAGPMVVLLVLIGGGALLVGLVSGGFALPLAVRWYVDRKSSVGVTIAVVHAGIAWLALIVGTFTLPG